MSRVLKGYWHEAMLKCVEPHTESPDRFITWSSFSVLGSVMKRKFFIRDGLFTIYPNQYIILVSPPGIGKGTAIQFVWGLVRQNQNLANMISDRVTAPKIIERIATGWSTPPSLVGQHLAPGIKEHACCIYSTELSMLVGASDQMLDFLCESWDRGEYDYDTKNSGSAFIKDMCTSVIGGTVPDFIRNIDRNHNMSIKGGFTSRCLFIYEDQPARYLLHPPPIEKNPNSAKILSALKDDLQHISKLQGGEYIYTPSAEILFDSFITGVRNTMKNDIDVVAFFKSRVRAHILKLAMVLAISRHDRLVIEYEDMKRAIYYIKRVLDTIELVFRGSGDSDIAVATGYVQTYIEKVGAASKKDILKNLYRHMSIETLDRVLHVLTQIGVIYEVTVGKTILYRIYQPNGQASVGPNGAVPNGAAKAGVRP